MKVNQFNENQCKKVSNEDPLNFSNLKIKKEILAHTSAVCSICLLQNGKLASCSRDKTIKIFNLGTYQCESVLDGFNEGVSHISILSNGNLASASFQEIKLWDVTEKMECIHTFSGQNNYINKVIRISDTKIASCSSDRIIKIWNSAPPYECISTLHLTGNVQSILELKNKKYFVSCGADIWGLHFWNTTTFVCDKTIKKVTCHSKNSMIEINNNQLVIAGSHKISVVDTEKFLVLKTIRLEEMCVIRSFLFLEERCLIFGTERGMLFSLEVYKNKITHLKDFPIIRDENINFVNQLVSVNDRTFVSCSDDKLIRVWEF